MSESVTEWDAMSIVRADDSTALIVLNEPLSDTPLFRKIYDAAEVRVAADGAANRLHRLDQVELAGGVPTYNKLEHIIGDLDSIKPNIREYYCSRGTQIHHITEQLFTDFGKAITLLRSLPEYTGTNIIGIGSAGGRVDQGVCHLSYLYRFHRDNSKVFLLDSNSLTFYLKPGKHIIKVKDSRDNLFSKYAGILPMNGPARITLKGFQWDVTDWPTSFTTQMSTSNHILPESMHVEVTTNNGVLFMIGLKTTE